MFPSNGKQTTLADGEVEVEEKRKKERNMKEQERERVTPRDVAHKHCKNRDKIWYHKVKIYEGTSL